MKRRAQEQGKPSKAVELVQHDLPGMPFFRDSPAGASGMLLRTASDVFSRWFLAMRSAVARERERQAAYREENGFKKKTKVPSQPLSPTEAEKSVAMASESVIRSMFGDSVADYARDRFDHAMKTGDMRSFKIRLLMLKARDSLSGLMKEEFARYANIYISDAETVAGCKQSSGPRRMSRAEKERKRRKEEARRIHESSLFPMFCQDKQEEACKEADPITIDNKADHRFPSVPKIVSSISNILGKNTIEDLANNIKSEETGINDENKEHSHSVTVTQDIEENSVTVTHENQEKVTVTQEESHEQVRHDVVRKARDYEKASEIIEDINAGKIVPYGSASEVVNDMKNGVLSPYEAMLFISVVGDLVGSKSKRGRALSKKKVDDNYPQEQEDEEDFDNDGDEDPRSDEDRFGEYGRADIEWIDDDE